MCRVHHFNFGTTYDFDSLERAQQWVKQQCFEASIWSVDGELICTYSPISGFREHVECT